MRPRVFHFILTPKMNEAWPVNSPGRDTVGGLCACHFGWIEVRFTLHWSQDPGTHEKLKESENHSQDMFGVGTCISPAHLGYVNWSISFKSRTLALGI